MRDPKVFLFDEPLSNLDAALRVSTRGEIAAIPPATRRDDDLCRDQVEAMTMGTRICIMNGGRVAQVESACGLSSARKYFRCELPR